MAGYQRNKTEDNNKNMLVVSAAKLPILNLNEFDLWKMRIEQYFLMTDYSLWEVILNGDSLIPTRVIDGVVQPVAPTIAEQRLARKNELKARGTLLMALPDKHYTNESVSAVTSVFAASTKVQVYALPNVDTLSDAVIYSFFASQSNSPQLDNDDLKQIDADDLKEMDLKWQMVMLIIRARRFLHRTRRTLGANGTTSIGFDMSKVECYNCHMIWHFVKECMSPKDTRNKETQMRNVPVETSTSNTLVSQCDGVGSYDWSFQADEEPTNYAIMAFASSSSSSSDNEVAPCSKACTKAYATLQSHYDKLTNDLRKSQFDVLSYKTGLESVEARIAVYQQNETVFEEDIKLLKLDVMLRDNALVDLRNKFKKVEQERDDDELISYASDVSMPSSLVYNRYKSIEGYHAVSPPYTGTFMPPKPDLVFHYAPTINEIIPTAFNVEPSTTKPNKDLSHSNRPFAPIIKDWVYDSEDESEGEPMHTQKAPSFVQTFEHVKTPTPSVKPVEHLAPAENLRKDIPKTRDHRHSLQHQRPTNHGVNKAYSPTRRPFNLRPSPKHRNFHQKVTTVKTNQVNAVEGQGKLGNPQHALKDKGVIDNGCSRHMTWNISYLSEFEETNRGYVNFDGNPKGGKITGKGKIRIGKLDFDDVYFVKEFKFNLFSVSQMCGKKNIILFTDTECIVLSSDFKLLDDNHVLLRVPRENNMYNVDLKNIVPSGDLTCLFAKATLYESNLWHRRLGHINFKTMNKLVKSNLVRGLPSKVFKNNHTCVACKKGEQHRACCKTKHVSSVSQPIQRSDNESEFKNQDLNQFCGMKGIKREFSVARTPQQNGIAERNNRTLIEAARTMLADSLLPISFWAEAVNTARYVQNRVLVIKPHNKTPYELLLGRTYSIAFMRPFGCLVTILNTLDPLGKFDRKADKGFLVGYSVSSKAFRVFNSRTRIVQETLHINFLENQPNVTGSGPTWLFDIDTLTQSMNYQPVVAGNQPNSSACIQEHFDADKPNEGNVQQYVLFPLWSTGFKDPQNTDVDATFEVKEPESEVHVSLSSSVKTKEHDDRTKKSINEVNAASTSVTTIGKNSINSTNTFSAAGPSNTAVSPTLRKSSYVDPSQYPDDPDMPALEEITPDASIDSLFETTPRVDVQASTTVAPLTLTAPTLPPPTIPTISQVPQPPTPPTTAPSTFLLRDEAQAENEEFLNNLDENVQKIIKEQVKERVKGSKRRREGKEPELTSALKEKATKTTGKSTQGSKSHQKTASESAPVEEPMQTTQDLEEPSHQEFETGVADDQPTAEAFQHPEWFQQQKKPPTLNRAWNTTNSTDLQSTGSLLEMSTHNVESSLSLNFRLLNGIVTSIWIRSRCIEMMTRKLTNLTVEERFAFNVSLRMFTRSIVVQRRVEDLQLDVESYQKKLNLTKPDTYHSNLKRNEAYTAYSNPRGFIYQNKEKQNRLMRIDEVHKFSDGTLNDVRTALDDRLNAKDKEDHVKSGEPELEGSIQGYPLVSVEVLRYDKRSKSENMGIVPTEMELILEYTQQGISHEVSYKVSAIQIVSAASIAVNTVSSNTNELVSTVTSFSTASTTVLVIALPNVDNLSDAVFYSFFASQSNSLQLHNDDLKQIDADDLEEMDLKWQMAMLTIRARRNKETQRRNVLVETSTFNALVSKCDGVGSYDWSFQADEEPKNYALMAFTSLSSSSSNNKVASCYKACSKAYATLKSYYDKLTNDLIKSQFDVLSYKTSLESVEARLVVYQQNEHVFEEDIKLLRLDVMLRNNALNLSKLLASQITDKTGLGYDNQVFNSTVFDCDELISSESDVSMPTSPVHDRYKSGEGFHDVPPSYTGTFMPLKPDLVFHDDLTTSEIVLAVFPVKPSTTKPHKDLSQSNRPSDPLIEDWIFDSEDEYEGKHMPIQKAPSFVQPSEHVKTPRPSVKLVEHPILAENLRKDILKHVVTTVVLTRSRLVLLTAARPITTVVSQTKVQHQRLTKHGVNKDVKGNWVWKPKCPVLDDVSRHISASMTLKQFDYTYALGRSKVPRENNMYNVDLKNIVPLGNLTCLLTKATSDESNLWHKRLGYINFKTMNKLVKGTGGKEAEFDQQYVLLPLWSSSSKDPQNIDATTFDVKEPEFEVHVSLSSCEKTKKHDDKNKREAKGKSHVEITPVTTVGPNSTNSTTTFSVVGPSNTAISLTLRLNGKYSYVDPSQYFDDLDMPALEDITYSDDVGVEADFSNLETNITISTIPTTKVHKDHPITQIIGDLSSAPQTRKDLEMLWKLVQERFQSLEPKNFSDDFLLNTFNIMFEKPNVEASIWAEFTKYYVQPSLGESGVGVLLVVYGVFDAIIRIEQYFLMNDYSLWEVILNGDSPAPTRVIEGIVPLVAPTTAEQRLARKNKLKARGSSFESLDQIHDRLQKLISQLEILRESLSQEDINLKFLRSLLTNWRTHTLIWRNKIDLEEQSLDDLFNSLKIYEAKVKSSSYASTSTQNIAFVSSSNNDSTNEPISAAASDSAVSAKIHVSALPNRTKRNLGANGPTSIGFDMSKVECYNYHRKGHFARKCSYDWSFQTEEEPTNYALMAFTSSSSFSSDNEVVSCSKAYTKSYATLASHYDELTDDFRKSQFDVIFYKTGLESIEARLLVYQQNEYVFEEDIKLLKLKVQLRDNALVVLRKKLKKSEQERDDLKLKLENSMFDCDEMFTSESDESLPPSPILDRYQLGDGYHDVPPPYTGTFMPPKPDLVFHNAPNVNATVHIAFNVELSPTKPDNDLSHTNRPSAPIIEDWVSDSGDDFEAEIPQNAPILTKSKLVPITAARPVTTDVPKPHVTRPIQAKIVVTKPHSLPKRHINSSISPKASNFPLSVTAVKAPIINDKGVIDSGCSRNMTGNMSYLSDFEELNGGYVAFRGNPKGGKISRKSKIKTGKLDFDDVYFVKELKFNLFSVSQMCEKKNSVLFTGTECLVLSPEFKLPDENQVLLRVPRENNMYNVDLKNIVPSGDLTCLFAKATLDKSNLWHKRLGHINFKTMNKLVKGNLVQGLPTKVFENDHTCVACKKGKQHRASCKTKPAEAVNTACYVQNRVLVTKPQIKTPYELLLGRTPSIGFMRPFGCLVTIFNTLDPLGKFDGKVDEVFLVGYTEPEFKGRKPQSEDHVSPSSIAQTKKHDNKSKREAKGKSHVDTNTFSVAGPSNAVVSPTHIKSSYVDTSQLPDDPNMPELEDITYSDDEEYVDAEADFTNLETTITVSPILTTRVHKDHHEERINYEEVFAPVARIETIRLFLAYASFMGFMVYQMDVKSAFLYGTIEEEVYVCQPPGFEDPDYPDKKQDEIFISQDKYVAEILRKFSLIDGKSASTPIDTEKPLLKDPNGSFARASSSAGVKHLIPRLHEMAVAAFESQYI
nr:ribonuclease H-like domain-containing protein [Tanacetum cinerariifolium]